jgi:hypothetical protein
MPEFSACEKLGSSGCLGKRITDNFASILHAFPYFPCGLCKERGRQCNRAASGRAKGPPFPAWRKVVEEAVASSSTWWFQSLRAWKFCFPDVSVAIQNEKVSNVLHIFSRNLFCP